MTSDNSRWSYEDLRITANQADYLSGMTPSWSQKLADITEDSLAKRGMIMWKLDDGAYYLMPSPKGEAAMEQYDGAQRRAA